MTPDNQRAEMERFLSDLRMLVREVAISVVQESHIEREVAKVAETQGVLQRDLRAIQADVAQRIGVVHDRVEASRREAESSRQGGAPEAAKIAESQQRWFEHLLSKLDTVSTESQRATQALVERATQETRDRLEKDFARQRRITHGWMIGAFAFGFVNFLLVLLLLIRSFR